MPAGSGSRARARLRAAALALVAGLALPACATDGADGPKYLKVEGPAEVRLLPRGRYRGWLLGGLSGLAWDGEASRLLAVGDRGHLFELPTTPEGRPAHVARLAGPDGYGDAEALRPAPGGGWLVLYEDAGAVARYVDAAATAKPPADVAWIQRLAGLPRKAGGESLAVLAPGRLLVIEEKPEAARAFILAGATARTRPYPSSDGFSAVDAARLPDNDVLVLERRFNGFLPPFFSSRLVRLSAASLAAETGPLEAMGRLDLTGLLPDENWEGIAIAPTEADGGPTLWLVSDDNLQWPQNTLLARLPLADVLARIRSD